MVWIVTGGIDKGKTARVLVLWDDLKDLGYDGIVSLKVFEDEVFKGYTLKRLSDGTERMLAVREESKIFRLQSGNLFFDPEAFVWADDVIDEICKDPRCEGIIIDEIGPLELRGMGLYDAFTEALLSGKEVIAVVRKSSLEDVLENFEIEEFVLIDVEEEQ
jgi:nucleoside-triphosphatase THEP1